jgi:hypothetical protein
VLEARVVDARLELLLLQCVLCAFGFGPAVQAAIGVRLLDARLFGLPLAKFIEIDDLAHASTELGVNVPCAARALSETDCDTPDFGDVPQKRAQNARLGVGNHIALPSSKRGAAAPEQRSMAMFTILFIILVLALIGGGLGHSRYGYAGWSPAGVLLVILLLLMFTGHRI